MAAMMITFLWLGVFFTVGGLLEKAVPEKVWDKLIKLLHFN